MTRHDSLNILQLNITFDRHSPEHIAISWSYSGVYMNYLL